MSSPVNALNPEHRQFEDACSVSLASKTVGVSSRQLYYWEQIGIVQPSYAQFGSYHYRRYSKRDIDVLVKIKRLLDQGYTLRASAQMVLGAHFKERANGSGEREANGSDGERT